MTTTSSRENRKRGPKALIIIVIISSGGLPICSHPMKLAYARSRLSLGMGTWYLGG